MLSCLIQVTAASYSLCLKLHAHVNYCLKIWLQDLSKYWNTSGQKESLGATKSNLQRQGKAILKLKINSKLLLETGPDVFLFSILMTLLWFTWSFEKKKKSRKQPSVILFKFNINAFGSMPFSSIFSIWSFFIVGS